MISLLKFLRMFFKVLFAAFFIFGGFNHFRDPGFYLQIMPPWIPWHLELIYVTGVMEIVLGALFLIPRFTRPAAWGLAVLLVLVFPANLHMALHTDHYPDYSPLALWARLPLQGILIAIALAYARNPKQPKHHDRARIPD